VCGESATSARLENTGLWRYAHSQSKCGVSCFNSTDLPSFLPCSFVFSSTKGVVSSKLHWLVPSRTLLPTRIRTPDGVPGRDLWGRRGVESVVLLRPLRPGPLLCRRQRVVHPRTMPRRPVWRRSWIKNRRVLLEVLWFFLRTNGLLSRVLLPPRVEDVPRGHLRWEPRVLPCRIGRTHARVCGLLHCFEHPILSCRPGSV
jgi:hypothetical protein